MITQKVNSKLSFLDDNETTPDLSSRSSSNIEENMECRQKYILDLYT